MKTQRQGKYAFTLVELLVVITIIGLLVSLLLPGLNLALAKGKEKSCQNSLRQLALGLHSYAASHFGRMPKEDATLSWMGQVDPFLSVTDKSQVRLCPVAGRIQPGAVGTVHGNRMYAWMFTSGGSTYVGSLAINKAMYAPAGTVSSATYFTNTSETDSRTPLFTDGSWLETPLVTGTAWPSDSTTGANNNFILNRHRKGISVAYADAHTDRVSYEYIFDQRWSKNFTPLGKQPPPNGF